MAEMESHRRLYLLRHAKSDWEDARQSDHDRPLAPRGREVLPLLHDHLRVENITPELVLCSTSRRTVETLAGVEPAGEVALESGLYGASDEEILTRLRTLPDNLHQVMVIGHNPGLQRLILTLTGNPDHPDVAEVRRKFPTGALATLEFTGRWAKLAPAGARLSAYVRPKTLPHS